MPEASNVYRNDSSSQIDSGGIACFVPADDDIISEKMRSSPALAHSSGSCRRTRGSGKEKTIIEAALENRQIKKVRTGFQNLSGLAGKRMFAPIIHSVFLSVHISFISVISVLLLTATERTLTEKQIFRLHFVEPFVAIVIFVAKNQPHEFC